MAETIYESVRSQSDTLHATLESRFQALEEQYTQKIGEVHPRLSIPELRRTIGDHLTAELTYGDVLGRIATEETIHLPADASVCEDPFALTLLMEEHFNELKKYLLSGRLSEKFSSPSTYPVNQFQDIYGDTEAGTKNDWVHPLVSGYYWFRGFQATITREDAVIILQPFMMPTRPSGSPFPELYIIGNPGRGALLDVVSDYANSRVRLPLDKTLQALENEFNQ